MDADEQLEVDDDFDWTPLNDTSIQSFNYCDGAGSYISEHGCGTQTSLGI